MFRIQFVLINKMNRKIITLIIILIGLVLSIYGALNYQNILSRAGGGSDYGNFEIKQVKDGTETLIQCADNICETQSLDVKLQIKDINQFENP